MKQIILLSAFMTSVVLTAAADEYIDPQTNVVYIYEVGLATASVKAGYEMNIGSGYGTELEEVLYPGCPEAMGDVVILDRFTVGKAEYVVTSVGRAAFRQNRNIKSVRVPETVTDIGEVAFQFCDSLTAIYLSNNLMHIGPRSFFKCERLMSADIPSSVRSIGDYAFADCWSLYHITLPESITNIGRNILSGCYFTLDTFINKSTLTSGDNWGAILCDAETDEGLMLKDNIIVFCRPWLCVSSVTIPDGVTGIGKMAFNDCRSLTHVTLPNSVIDIADFAFFSCRGLTTVILPSSVTNIGYGAFGNCNRLADVYCYAENVPHTSVDAFERFDIMSATLHVPTGSVDKYKSASPWSNFGSIIAMDTPVNSICNNKVAARPNTYDLSGRPASGKPQRGLYIQNGHIKARK